MDWIAFNLSLKLSLTTVLILTPLAIFIGQLFARQDFIGKSLLQALITLPLVLPPTVLGYFLLVTFSPNLGLGAWLAETLHLRLVFSFEGLLLASVIVNLPFAIQPMQRAFSQIPLEIREAAQCCGLNPWRVLWKIELPLAWPGVILGMIMTFAHTLGEFGIVLMVGGNIPGETQTLAIAIYEKMQLFDQASAAIMALVLLLFSLLTISLSLWLATKSEDKYV
jgi:molybdate transport system permease protein